MNTINIPQLPVSHTQTESAKIKPDTENIAKEFERIFARQMIQQMTKDLFDNSNSKGILKSGSNLYKEQITDVLAVAFAEQEHLGMAEMIRNFWSDKINQKIEIESIKSDKDHVTT